MQKTSGFLSAFHHTLPKFMFLERKRLAAESTCAHKPQIPHFQPLLLIYLPKEAVKDAQQKQHPNSQSCDGVAQQQVAPGDIMGGTGLPGLQLVCS